MVLIHRVVTSGARHSPRGESAVGQARGGASARVAGHAVERHRFADPLEPPLSDTLETQ
jgi:hypothetical protein